MATLSSLVTLISRERKRAVTASTSTISIDLNTGDQASVFKLTLSANTTLTFTNPPPVPNGETFSFVLKTLNEATAGRALVFGNTIKWAGGILPPRNTSANSLSIWSFIIENGVYYGSLSIDDAK
jgi:hypothetical protein